jgi:S-(hydroxymethyl)glutathione dehydrogenase/alcohol dehydrogenase
MPDGTSRFSLGGKKLHHYMGCSTFSNFTVLPEIAVAKIRARTRRSTRSATSAAATTGIGAVINTAKVEPGAKAVVFGLGGIGPNVIQLQLARRHDHRGRRQQRQEGMGRALRHDPFVNAKEVGAASSPISLT